ncbi:hypothetical protein B0T26DRAFT_646352 [Lasiosphaeria miniovina]|uniref:DUF7730 domain-containing protein n=1 Tax=Lasiosphaeria miniovina TaxID=1954250 RepID=A0AA40AME8_9PEZI|nr:uncharacterized protein B0T26DRAFT_646352 [Lasiosphaeria miniovina]KAK0718553.1 hypothetical protein B0T26DRAFT_646352 [Lasiosphaeria miniovina]
MQQNKERQRKVRHELHKSFPKPGSLELELWERNQQVSPFFRLPPELRNRIYELVLSVGQINVCYKRWEHKPRRPVEGGFWCRLLDTTQNPWTTPGTGTGTELHGMTLLSPVCRQLYHETALLPYSMNAWSFESPHVMDRYVVKEKRLPRPQRRAIRMLYSQHVLTTATEKFFGGLEVILLQGGIKMTKHVVDVDPDNAGRRTIVWDVSHHW